MREIIALIVFTVVILLIDYWVHQDMETRVIRGVVGLGVSLLAFVYYLLRGSECSQP